MSGLQIFMIVYAILIACILITNYTAHKQKIIQPAMPDKKLLQPLSLDYSIRQQNLLKQGVTTMAEHAEIDSFADDVIKDYKEKDLEKMSTDELIALKQKVCKNNEKYLRAVLIEHILLAVS